MNYGTKSFRQFLMSTGQENLAVEYLSGPDPEGLESEDQDPNSGKRGPEKGI